MYNFLITCIKIGLLEIAIFKTLGQDPVGWADWVHCTFYIKGYLSNRKDFFQNSNKGNDINTCGI